MRNWRTLAVFAFLLAAAQAQSPDELANAVRPLAEGIPQVAIVRLRALLQTDLPEDTKRTALLKLAQASNQAGQPEETLKLLEAPALRDSAEGEFYRAQALAALSRWAEALPLYQSTASEASLPWASEARFGEAEALRALGRPDQALEVLTKLARDARWTTRARFTATEILLARGETEAARRMLESARALSDGERRERRYLGGRIAWETDHPQRAINMFASVLKRPKGATHALLMASLFALADAHLQLNTPESGDDYLEDYIEHRPNDSGLPALFAKLDQLYAAERRQSRHEFGRWSRDPAQPRRALARWYLARAELRLGHRDAALQVLEQLRRDHPALPALAEAFNEYAELTLQDGRAEEAREILQSARALAPAGAVRERTEFLSAQADYAAGNFAVAAQTFRQATQDGAAGKSRDALFNTSLAWLQAGDAPQAGAAARELKERGADERTLGDLALEDGLVQAARGDAAAAVTLAKFARENPQHPRVAEAWVALAELAFHAAPPRLEEARQDLQSATESQPSAVARERADYLRVWLEDASGVPNESKAIEAANIFIRRHETSPLLPEVRLKLAEIYYRRQDFASAQTQFESLAQDKSPLAEKAQFFAAASAMRSMSPGALARALELFDEVVKANGEWKWAARNEQAVIERKLGKPQDALTLYDEVLKGDARPAEKREALCGKGDVFYDMGAAERDKYQLAIDAYTQLAAEPAVPAHWKNQALFKKGMCLERLEQPTEALATFYEVMDDGGRPDRRREFFWFYKAGFNAARLLEEQQKWQPAAAIYEKLAFAGGARSEEAKSRLSQLRLEHFLWDQ